MLLAHNRTELAKQSDGSPHNGSNNMNTHPSNSCGNDRNLLYSQDKFPVEMIWKYALAYSLTVGTWSDEFMEYLQLVLVNAS